MSAETPARKLIAGALIVVGAFVPVALYDRLVAQRVLAQQAKQANPPSLSQQQVVDLFHQINYWQQGSWQTKWLGVDTLQNPNDVWVTQEIIFEHKPDFIVETGTLRGGSAAIWAMVQEQVNPKGRVITIDIEDQRDVAKLPAIWSRRIDFILGSSTAPEVVAEVTRRVRGSRSTMVLLDSDHSKAHVKAELLAYAPLVSVGNYLIVQDTNTNGHPVRTTFGPGPMEALEDFVASDDRFQSDRTRERLLLTYHPKGYLKRLK
jgi:cephalosporin hydroxylase